jgi:hypothetical protein
MQFDYAIVVFRLVPPKAKRAAHARQIARSGAGSGPRIVTTSPDNVI